MGAPALHQTGSRWYALATRNEPLSGKPRRAGSCPRALNRLRRLRDEVVCAGVGIPPEPSQLSKDRSRPRRPEKQNVITFCGFEGHREGDGPMPAQDRSVWQCGHLSVLQHVGAGPRRESQRAVLDPEAYRGPAHPAEGAR
jgi:hypothetical protein